MNLVPTFISFIKACLGIPIYLSASVGDWGSTVIWAETAIALDYGDGFAAGHWGSIRGGDIMDAITDMWQFPFFLGLWQGGLLPWWYVLIVIPVFGGLSFFVMTVFNYSWARVTLWLNSMVAMILSFSLIGNELLGGTGVIVVLLTSVIMGIASWDILQANKNGEPVRH